MRDACFEAAYLRAGLLVGLIHEREVPQWAEEALDAFPSLQSALAGVLCVPVALSPMRDALQALAPMVDDPRVSDGLFCTLSHNAIQTERPTRSIVRVLSDMRRELRVTPEISRGIKDFDDRLMLAEAGVRGAVRPTRQELTSWMDSVRKPSLFLFQFERLPEAAAFVGAVTRAIARKGARWDLRLADAARAWCLRVTSPSCLLVAVNEPAWAIVANTFSPLPLASRIPYAGLQVDGPLLFDASRVEPIGLDAAARLLDAVRVGPSA